MKNLILTLSCILLLSSCAGDAPLGKSMGRWSDFGVESMTQECAKGLEYIEVTMNDVIGKDTTGLNDRIAALKADINHFA